jgi:hypothetical protein
VTRFRDRLLTRQGAYAITSPGAILAGGAAAAVGIATGIPLLLAAVAGAAAYAGVAIARLPPGRARPDIRPEALRSPWRDFVEEAVDARERFDRAVAGARTGPLRTRLQAIADRVAEGVEESWRVATHGQALEEALGQLEPLATVEGRLAEVEAERRGARADDARLEDTAEALRSQIDSTRRIGEVARATRDRLRLLDARLDESVARAVELSLRAGDATEASGLGSDVEAIVTEMESLRLALEETAVAG